LIIAERLVFADDDRDQVGRVRLRLAPVIGSQTFFVVFADADQFAVREREVRRLDGGDYLSGHLLVGHVAAGEPPVRVLVLALRPDLARLVRIGLVRLDEEESLARRTRVGDLDGQPFAAGVAPV
jgi:hypothetical protein